MTLPGAYAGLPLALAALTGLALVGLERGRRRLARGLGIAGAFAQLVIALVAVVSLREGAPLAVEWCPWPSGAGLTLFLDPLAAWLLAVTAVLALIAATVGDARQAAPAPRPSWLQFQLVALNGLLLVSDLVSFVACLLLAWGLAWRVSREGGEMPHGRLVLGVGACALVLAVGGLYAAVGTVDFAGLAIAAPAVPAADAWLPTGVGFVLAAVFTLGAAAAPLVFAPSRAVAPLILNGALVGGAVYALTRLFTLVFPCFVAGPCGPSGLVLPLALSLVSGGALATLVAGRARDVGEWLVVFAIGVALVTVGSFRAAGLGAALVLVTNAMLASAVLVLARHVGSHRLGSVLRLLALAALLGLPPLPGFVGSVALLRASGPDALAVWTLVLGGMLLALTGAVRASMARDARPVAASGPAAPALGAAIALLTLMVAAGPALDYGLRAARQILDRNTYVTAVATARGRAPPDRG